MTVDPDGTPAPVEDETDVPEFGRRVEALRAEDNEARWADAVAALESAYEKLRVAAEELATQQSQRDALLDEVRAERSLRDRLCLALPVAVITTGTTGTIREANGVAAAMLHVTPRYLRGKPLAAFVELADRRSVRGMLTTALETTREQATTVTLRPRRITSSGPAGTPEDLPELVAVVVLPDGHGPGSGFRWVLMPASPGSVTPVGNVLIDMVRDAGAASDLRQALTTALLDMTAHLGAGRLASVTVGSPAEPTLQIWDGPLSQAADAAQLAAGEGPCVEAYETGKGVSTPDAMADPRWPGLTDRLGAGGVRAILGTPLIVAGETEGALNIYATVPIHLDAVLGADAELFADALAALLEGAQRREALEELARQLERALVSRAEIDHAIGVVVGLRCVGADAAFKELVRLSQDHNVKVRDLAPLVVAAAQQGRDPLAEWERAPGPA
jgi:PAS domain-containing protein